jgi:protein phosphatase
MKVSCFAISCPGKDVVINQDRFLCFKEISSKILLWEDGFFSLRTQESMQYGYLFAIADGLGGHNAGEVASNQAIRLLWKQYYSGPLDRSSDILDRLQEIFRQAHEEIRILSRSKFEYRGMGTTLTAAILKEETLYWAHIGDSRLYRISDSQGIQQLTEDHTLIARGIREGFLNQKDITKDHKGELYQAIAVSPQLEVQVGRQRLSPPEWILLCSDGLTDVLDEGMMEGLFRGKVLMEGVGMVSSNPPSNVLLSMSPKEVCERLIRAADKMGREDDITIVAVKIE